ncbi:hypothetical protein L2721_11250, partial [Lactobacillus crispatus]|nr:hypothetical protein [Lactobacillus crispatus]MCZ3683730.1 hypothetical protein [Lactobacillus crispatus]
EFTNWNPTVPTTGTVAEGTYTAQYEDTDKVKTPDPKKPGDTPEGYVRVTFDATKDGNIDGNQFKYLDVRSDVTWDDAAVTAKIPATAAYKDATKEFTNWNPTVPTTGTVAEGTYTAQYE